MLVAFHSRVTPDISASAESIFVIVSTNFSRMQSGI